MQITVNISESDLKALKNDLLDVDKWVQDAVVGKIHKCKGRMIAEWMPKLMADPAVASVPADEVQLIDLICARPDYKDRLTVETELKAK